MASINPSSADFIAAVKALASELEVIDDQISKDKKVSPEDQLKTPIHNFLMTVSSILGRKITVVTEHSQNKDDEISGVRLDMAVKRSTGPLIGHVELKSTLKGANPFRATGWTKHDKAQWKKLKNHSNLIYSNGWEWTLSRQGLNKPLVHVVLDPDAQGNVSDRQLEQLAELLTMFMTWKPTTPSSPRALAELLAPLTAYLRDSVVEVVGDDEDDALDGLYARWRVDFMPGATKPQFADSFAQTFTYSLLLARVESDLPADSFTVSAALTRGLRSRGHKLLGAVLELMGQEQFRELVEDPITLLEATIGAVDSGKFSKDADPWLYFYEDFLAAYNPKMRKEAGVYYTPIEIVQAQVRLVDHALKTRFGRHKGLGDDDVNILDPAAGTATYPLAIIDHVMKDAAAPQDAARSLSKRLNAFELLMGPYAVAHLRVTQLLEASGIQLDKDGVNVFFTNTLLAPGNLAQDTAQYALWHVEADLTEESRRAGIIKDKRTPVRVVIGNPPYKRGKKAEALGTETIPNVVLQPFGGHDPLLNDFTKPLKALGAGGQIKNLYNLYVYFIRWALWKACQQNPQEPGIVSFITGSSYLRGPAFAGVREYMRRVFDEIWIIDLGGDNRGARPEDNVFKIETPVAIFVGVQHEKTVNSKGEVVKKRHDNRMKSQAKVYYRRIFGLKAEKLDALNQVTSPDVSPKEWTELKQGEFTDKLVPSSAAALGDGVPIQSVFPWYFSGSKAGRTWVIAPTKQALDKRISQLQNVEDKKQGQELFADSPSGRKYFTSASSDYIVESATKSRAISVETNLDEMDIVRFGYRSFDRQYHLADHRVVDRPGASWNLAQAPHQVFMVTLTATAIGDGPAMTVSPYAPDLHFFRGSYGAKSTFPLFKDRAGTPNISADLMSALSKAYGCEVSAEEVAGYVVGQLGTSAYTERFGSELLESEACVIFTADKALFDKVSAFGKKLIFEATWGERMGVVNAFGQVETQRYRGKARGQKATTLYPEKWSYDRHNEVLTVGDGEFVNVSNDVMDYEVSGMGVVSSWLGYRMKNPAGKSTSALDRVQADQWTHDTELLELLWQVEFFVNAEEEAATLLQKVTDSELIKPVEIGSPTEEEMTGEKGSGGQAAMEFDE